MTVLQRLAGALFAAVLMVGAAAVAPAVAGGHSRSGEFTGASNHVTTGSVEVRQTEGGGYEIVLGEDFFFDGAPDPRVGFGKDGEFVDPTDFEPLRENTGEQIYVVPPDLDPSEFTEVFIWCRQFSVPLGYAALN